MKKYHNTWACYGQSVAGRIAYYQKMGVANGIIEMLKHEMRSRGLKLEDWKKSETYNGVSLTFTQINIVIPTQEHDWLDGNCPIFYYDGKIGLIDMLSFDYELTFHIMLYDRETKSYKNGYWHTVREGLSLEDTCTLFEYVEDRKQELIILPLEESDKYNLTGALGIGI